MSNPLLCWNCGASVDELPRPISRHATCPSCFNELHACRMCRHFEPEHATRCKEDRADPPLVKENANFCDWFRPSPFAYQAASTTQSDSARAALDDLFGGTEPEGAAPRDEPEPAEDEPESDDARRKLDDLFRKD